MNFRIILSGNGAEIGVGKISKAQYDFWSKSVNAKNLNWEIQGNLDEDEVVPDEVRLSEHYEYMEIYCQSGVYEDGLELEIIPEDDEDDEGFTFSGDYDDFLDEFTFDDQHPIIEKTVKYPKKCPLNVWAMPIGLSIRPENTLARELSSIALSDRTKACSSLSLMPIWKQKQPISCPSFTSATKTTRPGRCGLGFCSSRRTLRLRKSRYVLIPLTAARFFETPWMR